MRTPDSRRFPFILFLSGLASAVVSLRAGAVPADPVIVELGQNHRTWQRISEETLPNGVVLQHTNSYVELSDGLHYFKDGQWRETKAEFKIFPAGAVAQEGPFQLILSPDISTEGAVDLLAPGGKRFISSPRWLTYYNRQTGQSVLIAAVKSCVGQLIEPNVIVFPDAFDEVHAALRYTYRPSGVEQDVVLLESGPLRPGDWGLNGNPADIVLEMWSEFHTAPEPDRTVVSDQAGLPDVTLTFGETRIGMGKAFSLGDVEETVSVGKTWTKVNQKQFLIEAVRQVDLAPLLAQLPQQAQANNPARRAKGLAQRQPAAGRSGLLALGVDRVSKREKRTEVASIQRRGTRLAQGVVLDYSTVSTTSNYRFKGDSTYYIANNVTLSGTTTIDGGAVIKFNNISTANQLQITGPIDCQTSPYRPAIFTAKDDNTVGESISGSTGNPGTNRYAGRALELNASGTTYSLHDLRFRYADKAIYVSASSALLDLSHSQIGYANTAVYNPNSAGSLRNVLLHDTRTGIASGATGTNTLENVTFHRVDTFRDTGTVYATNCLFICVTNGLVFTGSNVETNINDSAVFQTVGAAGRYLASQSNYRNAGTANVNPSLLADLKQRTTYPPIVLSSEFVANTTLRPQAMRDTDTLDLGYHYDCLDWCWSGKKLTNITLTLLDGVAVAFYDSSAAIKLYTGGNVYSVGLPTAMNRIAPYIAVQEEPTLWGSARTGALFALGESAPGTAPNIDLRLTAIDLFQGGFQQQDFLNSTYSLGRLCLTHCQMQGGYFSLVPQYNASGAQLIALTNSLFQWTYINLHQAYLDDETVVTVHLRNNLFRTNVLNLQNHTTGTRWSVHDNLLDSVNPSVDSGTINTGLTNSYNAFCNTATLGGAGIGNITLTSADYQTGPLGRFYYPTNGSVLNTLRGVGSRNADTAGLWHFTTTTNQVAETNSVVDIGCHFAALNSSNRPTDSDNDGLADCLEDASGNGGVNSGETDWANASDPGLKVAITSPRTGSNSP